MVDLAFSSLVVGVAPTDISDNAVHAAARLARLCGAQLDLLHAVPIPRAIWLGLGREQLGRLHSDALSAAARGVRERLAALEERFGLNQGELVEHLTCVIGDPADALRKCARSTGADVVVVGPHQEWRRFDFGRTLRVLLHGLETALWLQVGPWQAPERILVPVDLSGRSRALVDAAVGLARVAGASVSLLHVFEPLSASYLAEVVDEVEWPGRADEEYRALAHAELATLVRDTDWNGVEHTEALGEGRPADEILRRAPGYELVMMASRGHTAPVLGHVTYSVLRGATGAVLALRNDG